MVHLKLVVARFVGRLHWVGIIAVMLKDPKKVVKQVFLGIAWNFVISSKLYRNH